MLDCDTYNLETGEWKQVADDYVRLEAEVLKTVDIRSPKTVISVHFSYSLPMAMQIY